MKKLLSVLTASTIVASSATSVVACGSSRFSDIWLVTDTGKINDKSFNQSTFEGGNYFLNNILGNPEGLSSIAYSEPQDLAKLPQAYTNAASKGAKTLLLPGFHHSFEGENKAPDTMKDVDGSTILLDGSASGKENQIGVLFRGDISGFYGGLSAIAYTASERITKNKTDEIKLATYGGVSNPTAVDNFMVGYLAAVEYWNNINKSDQAKLAGLTDEEASSYNQIKATMVGSDALAAGVQESDKSWFTGSFSLGAAQTISKTLVDTEKADVIMPVAGPQTEDTLKAIKASSGSTTKIVGVDTDQVLAYPNYKEYFITSAQKDLTATSVIALGHVKAYIGNTTVQDNVTKYWEDLKLPLSMDDNDLSPTAQKGISWEGKDVYAGGKMGTNADNLIVKSGLYDKGIKALLEDATFMENILQASKDLFAEAAKVSGGNTILTAKIIEAYAKTIIGAQTPEPTDPEVGTE